MCISDNHVHLIVSCWLLIVFVCRQRILKTEYSKLWEVVSQLLLLSHGQASIERGFSINKHMERTNMCHETFIAEHIVNDHLRSVGGVLSVAINKELLASSGRLREVCSGWRTEDHHLHIRLLTALEVASFRKYYDTDHVEYVDMALDDRLLHDPYAMLAKSVATPGAYSEMMLLYAASAALRVCIQYCPTGSNRQIHRGFINENDTRAWSTTHNMFLKQPSNNVVSRDSCIYDYVCMFSAVATTTCNACENFLEERV